MSEESQSESSHESIEMDPLPLSPDKRFELAVQILDKQYELYAWNDSKMHALITTNSILFAAIGFLFKDASKETVPLILVLFSAVLLAASLIGCLRLAIPVIASGQSGSHRNIRSINGISQYPKWQSYFAEFQREDASRFLKDTVRQIYGMAHNNVHSGRAMRKGSYLTIVATASILIALVFLGFANAGTKQTDGTTTKHCCLVSAEDRQPNNENQPQKVNDDEPQ